MTKKTKLKICNWSLLIVAILVLVTSIFLEVQHGEGLFGFSFTTHVILHVIFATTMVLLVLWHLYLHFGTKQWLQKLKKLKSHVTGKLFYIYLIAFISGLIALPQWLIHASHTTIGGVHGKLALIFIIVAIGHAIKRIKWFKK